MTSLVVVWLFKVPPTNTLSLLEAVKLKLASNWGSISHPSCCPEFLVMLDC